MALRHRRGVYSDFDPSKMVAGETAVVQSGDPNTTSGKSVYVAPTAGAVKQVAFIEDVNEIVYNLTDEVAQRFNEQIADSIDRAESAASDASSSASTAGNYITRFTDQYSDGNIVITRGGS